MKDFQRVVAAFFVFIIFLFVVGFIGMAIGMGGGLGQFSRLFSGFSVFTMSLLLLLFVAVIVAIIGVIRNKSKISQTSLPSENIQKNQFSSPNAPLSNTQDKPLSLSTKILFYMGIIVIPFLIIAPIIQNYSNNQLKKYYEMLNQATSVSVCDTFKDVSKKERCVIDYLAYKQRTDVSPDLCRDMTNISNKDSCYDILGEQGLDPRICTMISDTDLKDSCLSRVADWSKSSKDSSNNSVDSATTTEDTPVITSITPNHGPKGTIVDIHGKNLNGFEGDLIVTFESSSGVKFVLNDTQHRGSTTDIVVAVKEPCQKGETVYADYSGKASICDYHEMTPGVYKVYTSPWGKTSNISTFTVLP